MPHDFSRHATRALKLAAVLAGRKGRLRVLHVLSDPYASIPGPPSQTWERNAENSHPEDEDAPRHLGKRQVPLACDSLPAGMDTDTRQLIARIAAAMMAADGRIKASELDAVQRLDALGLGPLSTLALDEIDRATYAPIDLDATCDGLAAIGPDAAAVLVAALAGMAVSDRRLSAREVEVFNTVAARLGLGHDEAACILESVIAAEQEVSATAGGTAVPVPELHT